MESLRATLQPTIRSVLSPVLVGGDMGFSPKLPTTGLLAWIVDGVDSIGLSIADKASVRTELWSLFFDENDDPYSDEQRVTNIEASALTNSGLELVWNPLRGGALYVEGTDMQRAYGYFDIAYPEPATSFDSLTEGQLDTLTEEQLDALGA